MSYQDFLVQFINSLSGLKDNCRILQIGPGRNTYEIAATLDSGIENQMASRQRPDKNLYCQMCPFRVECKRGRGIHDHQLPYGECFFDKIIIHAKANLQRKDLFDEADRILKDDGQVIVFMSIDRNSGNQILRDLCFHSDGIIEQLNRHHLAIKSASAFRLSSSVALCLTAGKYLEIIQ